VARLLAPLLKVALLKAGTGGTPGFSLSSKKKKKEKIIYIL
jgi:hypothetical protein